jgi:DNA-binding transcriptional LysR family regulator
MLPKEFVDDELRSGRLLHILPGFTMKPGLVHAIFPTRRGMVPAVRHLLDALVAGYGNLNRER